MMTHQGSRALNQTNRTHAPYSARATNQVGPSIWKNFCFRSRMMAKPGILPLTVNSRRSASRRIEHERRMYLGSEGMFSPIPACSLKIRAQCIIRSRVRKYEPLQQQAPHQGNNGRDLMGLEESCLQGSK